MFTDRGHRRNRSTIPLGEKVVQLPEGDRYLGFIFAISDEPSNTIKILKEAHGKLNFKIE